MECVQRHKSYGVNVSTSIKRPAPVVRKPMAKEDAMAAVVLIMKDA
jgi:hypothetical protein